MDEQGAGTKSAFQAIRAIDYTVIFVRDMDAMRHFYETLLGFSLQRVLSSGWINFVSAATR
jgi:predicted enzyme related to lactoylglutathione lyase